METKTNRMDKKIQNTKYIHRNNLKHEIKRIGDIQPKLNSQEMPLHIITNTLAAIGVVLFI